MKALTHARLTRLDTAAIQAKSEGDLLSLDPDYVLALVAELRAQRQLTRLQSDIVASIDRQNRKLTAEKAAADKG